jgi:hypothetical protein
MPVQESRREARSVAEEGVSDDAYAPAPTEEGAARLPSHIYRDAMFGIASDGLESSRWRERALELGWPAETL